MERALGRLLLWIAASCFLYYLITYEVLPALGR